MIKAEIKGVKSVLTAALLAGGVLCVSACRVDVAVDVAMQPNGSGIISVTVDADADVVEQAPGLADDLRFDDLTAAGWTVHAPTLTPAGGLSIGLEHGFDTPEQATALIATLSGPDGPLRSVSVARVTSTRSVTYTMTGSGGADSLTAFTDPDLVASVGATPYVDDITAAALAPGDAVGLVVSARLPGEVITSTATPNADGSLVWEIPIGGGSVELTTTTSTSLERGGAWPLLAGAALAALIAWSVLSVVTIAVVARARRLRSHRRSLR